MKTYSKNNDRMCSIKKCSSLANFIGKHLCQSVFFNKVASLRPVTLFKETLAKLVFCEFCEHLFCRKHPGDCVWYSRGSSCNLQFKSILQFVTISLLRVFTLAYAVISQNFCIDLLFGRVILSYALQDRV